LAQKKKQHHCKQTFEISAEYNESERCEAFEEPDPPKINNVLSTNNHQCFLKITNPLD
jgi:hypothetical protein